MDENIDSYVDIQTVNPVINKDEIITVRDPLFLELDDKVFLDFAKRLKKEADDFYVGKGTFGYDLGSRRQRNESYFFGRQLVNSKVKKYNSKALDNILWESASYLRAMAVSRLPDITVKPGTDNPDSKKFADDLSKIVTSDIQSRERKRVLGLAFKHFPVYYTGVIKAFWNPQKGANGDYDFRVVHPENLTLDFRAGSNDTRSMDYLFEACEYTVKELVMMFPDKEKQLYESLARSGKFTYGDKDSLNENNEQGMNSKVKIIECWFKWYIPAKEDKSDKSEGKKFEEIIAVAWYYQDLLLKKMKHPYWDWTGTPQTFTYEYSEVEGKKDTFERNKVPIQENQLRNAMLNGSSVAGAETETIFHNHLDYPQFPYIFLGFEQWGKQPLDETSWIEQAISLQEEYDKRNRQITEMIDRSRGKHVFSSSEGLTKDDVSNMDMSDYDQDIMIRGDVTKMHNFIPGEQPSPQMIENAKDHMERMFDKAGVHGATRGQVDTDTAATNNQLSREGDFSRMDDMVDDTINYAAEWIANWELQLMKLFYTKDHLKRLLGSDGNYFFMKLNRDLIEDGMEVTISASGTDKLKAEQRAMDMAKLKLIDPYRFFKDTNSSDPRGRTIDLMTFLMQPNLYLQNLQEGTPNGQPNGTGQQLSGALEGQITGGQPQQPGQPPTDPANQGGQSPQAIQDIMVIEQGQVPQVPQQVDPAYIQTMTQFMQSPQLQQLIQQHPEMKQPLLQFFQQIQALAQGQGQQNVGSPQPQVPTPQQGTPAGPTTGNPQPGNTAKVAVTPQQPNRSMV